LQTNLGTSNAPDDQPLNVASILDNLPYLNAICAETFRNTPAVPGTMRVAARDTSLGSYSIPAGTELLIPIWQLSRSEHLWGAKAAEFVPERWLDNLENDDEPTKFNNHGGAQSNFSFLIFLHGPRSCIGQGFAKAELRSLVASWVLGFEFEMKDPNEKIIPAGNVALKPKGGLHLRVRSISKSE
jgi:cytochrome P450